MKVTLIMKLYIVIVKGKIKRILKEFLINHSNFTLQKVVILKQGEYVKQKQKKRLIYKISRKQ